MLVRRSTLQEALGFPLKMALLVQGIERSRLPEAVDLCINELFEIDSGDLEELIDEARVHCSPSWERYLLSQFRLFGTLFRDITGASAEDVIFVEEALDMILGTEKHRVHNAFRFKFENPTNPAITPYFVEAAKLPEKILELVIKFRLSESGHSHIPMRLVVIPKHHRLISSIHAMYNSHDSSAGQNNVQPEGGTGTNHRTITTYAGNEFFHPNPTERGWTRTYFVIGAIVSILSLALCFYIVREEMKAWEAFHTDDNF